MSINNVSCIQNILELQNNQLTKSEIKNNEIAKINQPKKQMINAQMALASYKVPKINISFKGSIQNDEINDEEFEKLKKLLNNPSVKHILTKNENTIKNLYYLIENIDNAYQYAILNKILSNEELIENFMEIAGGLVIGVDNQQDVDSINELLDNTDYQTAKRIRIHYQNVSENSYLYVNRGQDSSKIRQFFGKNYDSLILLTKTFNDKTINALLRSRFNNAQKYLDTISGFNNNDIELLSKLAKSKNQTGSNLIELTEKEKIGFIDLISAYKTADIDTAKMQKMATAGVVDIKQLNKDLFNSILRKCGLSDEEIKKIPEDKLENWNISYMHLLVDTVEKDRIAFADLLRAANLDDFNRYIHDTSNEYGQANSETIKAFANKKMNYDKWLKPSQENNVQFQAKDSSAEMLSRISSQIKEDMETLMQTPAKGFIKKQFPNCVKDGKFIIPQNIENSKAQLTGFIQNILTQLKPVFNRSKNNPKAPETAQEVLNIQTRLEQMLKNIENIGEIKAVKTFDLTIKMWERNPQYDLFQGNYSTCCIGMRYLNGRYMPHYLMNTAYNMIEVKDNDKGNTIGNALCYFVEDEQGKPAFIIDNIEVKHGEIPSSEVGQKLRNKITEYASNVAKEVTGCDDTPIYVSATYNDVPTGDLEKSEQKVSFIGNIDCDEIYMDLYDGWVIKDYRISKIPDKQVSLLKLK